MAINNESTFKKNEWILDWVEFVIPVIFFVALLNGYFQTVSFDIGWMNAAGIIILFALVGYAHVSGKVALQYIDQSSYEKMKHRYFFVTFLKAFTNAVLIVTFSFVYWISLFLIIQLISWSLFEIVFPFNIANCVFVIISIFYLITLKFGIERNPLDI